jgi:hypothetical protein
MLSNLKVHTGNYYECRQEPTVPIVACCGLELQLVQIPRSLVQEQVLRC